MPHLTLFYAPHTCALATRIALNEAGADYQLQYVDFSQNAQRSGEYLALNPLGRVPALRLEDGSTVLTETVALLAYVAQRFPEAHLAPADPVQFARMQSFHSYLASTVHVAHAHGRRGARWSDDEAAIASMQDKVAANMAECCALIEAHWLDQGPWVMGEAFSVADAYLFTIAGWLQGDGVDIAHFPRLADHWQRMQLRPAVRAALHD
ncbi:glutathione S-transferase family protein [Comamonas terrigena]|uniref:glutathione S-transferase family protein n=1 Tax=Comamonas terrigena TaxID=32013 RepID=UPI00244D7840|nr:glutathione S-transferase family protein [Comamonas terrigena]MDH1292956.1 glutathione S-transferase family protein [Comamonas terrigena]